MNGFARFLEILRHQDPELVAVMEAEREALKLGLLEITPEGHAIMKIIPGTPNDVFIMSTPQKKWKDISVFNGTALKVEKADA